MCGSVNYEAKVTYKLLSSYKLVWIQTKQSVVSMARPRIKVLKLNQIIFLGTCMDVSSSLISFATFTFAFSANISIFVQIILIYWTFVYLCSLLLIIEMSSSVNYEAKVTYKLLSIYKLVWIQTKQSVVSMASMGLRFVSIF